MREAGTKKKTRLQTRQRQRAINYFVPAMFTLDGDLRKEVWERVGERERERERESVGERDRERWAGS